jgi:hypothetical protein
MINGGYGALGLNLTTRKSLAVAQPTFLYMTHPISGENIGRYPSFFAMNICEKGSVASRRSPSVMDIDGNAPHTPIRTEKATIKDQSERGTLFTTLSRTCDGGGTGATLTWMGCFRFLRLDMQGNYLINVYVDSTEWSRTGGVQSRDEHFRTKREILVIFDEHPDSASRSP